MFQIPPPMFDMPDIPPPGPAFQFVACLFLVFGAVEGLLTILPQGLQRKVNQIRFGPGWKG
jgi:hypothetical protein